MESHFDLIFSGIGADYLRAEADKCGSPAAYMEYLSLGNQHQSAQQAIAAAAEIVEPEDRTLGIDDAREASQAFKCGGLLGLAVARHFLRPSDYHSLHEAAVAEFSPSTLTDAQQIKHEAAQMLIGLAEQALNQAEVYYDLLEAWEDELCPSVASQPYLYHGFGFAMYMVLSKKELQDEAAVADFSSSLNSADFDAELQQLLEQENGGPELEQPG